MRRIVKKRGRFRPRVMVVGITGSVGSGKSEATRLLASSGLGRRILVSDADSAVHRLYQQSAVLRDAVCHRWPQVCVGGHVDRCLLGGKVFGDPNALSWLEGIIHPLLDQERKRLLLRARHLGCYGIVLDVPLLFETGIDKACHHTVCMVAPPWLCRQRVRQQRQRAGRKLAIYQWESGRKAHHARQVIPSGMGRRYVITKLLQEIKHNLRA